MTVFLPSQPLYNEYVKERDREDALVLNASFEDVTFLLTGDAGVMMGDYLAYLYGEQLESGVLKVGRHGLKTPNVPIKTVFRNSQAQICFYLCG